MMRFNFASICKLQTAATTECKSHVNLDWQLNKGIGMDLVICVPLPVEIASKAFICQTHLKCKDRFLLG